MNPYLTGRVSAGAIRHNLSLLRGCVGPRVKICCVVKADAYGHGLDLLWPLLAEQAEMLAVATPDEAVRLRGYGYRGPLLAFLTPCADGQRTGHGEMLSEAIRHGVTLTVTTHHELAILSRAAAGAGRTAAIHVKIDSGMHRGGCTADEAAGLLAAARATPRVVLQGVYTHFATADEADKRDAMEQLAIFRRALGAAGGAAGLLTHAANSAALIDLPESHGDMVRPGIAVYGYQPSDQMRARLPLRPALQVVAPLLRVKPVTDGSRCGYGFTHTFARDGRIGLVPVGYADGYLRSLSNRATVRVAGRDVPVCGRVSMDQIIIDLTDAPAAHAGDEVEIVSADPSAPHSVENLARLAGTIPYEITCRLNTARMQRVLVA